VIKNNENQNKKKLTLDDEDQKQNTKKSSNNNDLEIDLSDWREFSQWTLDILGGPPLLSEDSKGEKIEENEKKRKN